MDYRRVYSLLDISLLLPFPFTFPQELHLQPPYSPPPSLDHWQDVLTGSILGTVMTYFAYRQYYPPLNSDVSHIPYSPRHKRGGQVMTHNQKPSDTRGLTSDRFDDTSVRPRMPEQRYSDRPSLSDEEMRGPSMA